MNSVLRPTDLKVAGVVYTPPRQARRGGREPRRNGAGGCAFPHGASWPPDPHRLDVRIRLSRWSGCRVNRQLRRRAHKVLGPGRSASASRQRLQWPGRGPGSTGKDAQDGDQVSLGKTNGNRLNQGGIVRLNWRSTSWAYRASGLTKGCNLKLGAGWLRGSPTGSCVSTCQRGPISPYYRPTISGQSKTRCTYATEEAWIPDSRGKIR